MEQKCSKKGGDKLKLTLKAWRSAKGMSRQQLADRLGVSMITIKRWEDGTKMPVTMAVDACRVLDIDINDVDWN